MDEIAYLNRVIEKIVGKIDKLEETIDSSEVDYKELKKYTVDYKAELDKYEVYNFQQTMNYIDRRNVLESGIVGKLNYQREVPYFAKVGFCYEGEKEQEPFYIGRYGLADEFGEQLIYDWRAPISSLYYDFHLGKAYYESFGRKYHGELLEKRQFDIEKGQIKLMVDTEDTVNDDFLLQELGKSTSSYEMKTIIQTIQKEQNEVIRDNKTKNLIIQGVAGSGKTSIALHRMAYLLYQRRESLAAENILIISPNHLFSSYIATVLPELGENELQQRDITTVGRSFIEETIAVNDRQDELAELLENPQSTISQRFLYKRSSKFLENLEAYVEKLRQQLFAEDLKISQEIVISKVKLKKHFSNVQLPLFQLITRVSGELAAELKLVHKKTIVEKLKLRVGEKDSFGAYLTFLKILPEIYHGENRRNFLENSDLFPYLYFKLKLEGIKPNRNIQHLVIDEMQDYSLLHFFVLQELFPREKTICGDIQQAIIDNQPDFLEGLQNILPNNRLVEFNQSYRSSYEIVAFAKQFSHNQALTAVKRHGEPVLIQPFKDELDQITQLSKQLENFKEGPYKTCGIICQNRQEVERIKTELQIPVSIIRKDTKIIQNDIVLTTIQYAKGLEFDTVILPDIDANQLQQKSNLLYTCCTRALHQLILLIK
ncbi:HelD family protein [Enterococcus sp. AZ109]|uniref:HelD family protein n=1 Tax=Enterococcus sp. AZ109 TaxID=2774634 RepID=UPI003F1F800D